jgi:hexosaminidase
MLAMYKMNVFHWHLTDDQGWRIEIKQYPKLTEVGAWRKGSMVGAYDDNKFDNVRYGGFYTQNEINEIVAYASMNHITIVPEIEMPGHALAALAAYPEYSCSGKPCEVGMKWGVETNVFCPTEETFAFLGNILDEVISLFPGKYIHIGGDEVLKDEWNKSAFCLNLMKEKNLKDAHELQSYFITRIEKIVNAKGRMIIGWDEILEGGLAPNAAVMSWRGTEGGIAAAKQQHYVVMSPGSHCYFDHYQGNPETEPHAIGGFTPLEKVYSYEPTPDTLTTEEAKYILGAQANVWTEYITTTDHVEYMSMPRMAALAEVVWSKKENKNYDDFFLRIKLQQARLSRLGINYARTAFKEGKK